MMTLVWSALIVVFSYFAKDNIHWLWMVSLMIFFQYFTDVLDGAVGRLRNTGLIKWGYYMDHFLDFIFMCSIIIGWSFLLSSSRQIILLGLLGVSGAFMVNAYLAFSVTNKFSISYFNIGPSEMRILFIFNNILLVIFGIRYLERALPYFLLFSAIGLIYIVYKTQKNIWKMDMDNKNR